jgi:hypothetical protein
MSCGLMMAMRVNRNRSQLRGATALGLHREFLFCQAPPLSSVLNTPVQDPTQDCQIQSCDGFNVLRFPLLNSTTDV